jgi:hypothetical protein
MATTVSPRIAHWTDQRAEHRRRGRRVGDGKSERMVAGSPASQ